MHTADPELISSHSALIAHHFFHRFPPVEHGGEFQEQTVSLIHQLVHRLQHVRCAVGDAVGPCAMLVTARWVDEDQVGMVEGVQVFHAVGTDRLGLNAQQPEVLCSQLTQRWLALHIDGMPESSRHPGEVDTKATRQVDHQSTPACHLSLIGSRGLRRTLFHREMRWIDHAIHRRPRGQLTLSHLPSCYLLQGKGEVYLPYRPFPLQSQLAHVVMGVLSDIIACRFVHFVRKITKKTPFGTCNS